MRVYSSYIHILPLQIEKRPPVHADVKATMCQTKELQTDCLSWAEFDSKTEKPLFMQCSLYN